MLDTIALSLNQNEFEVVDMARFSPSAHGLYAPPYYQLGGRGNFSCYQNPTKTELMTGQYKPRITLTKRKSNVGYTISLRCEFSAPKLLFGNNFDELLGSDFERLLDVLQGALSGMGVRVQKVVLRRAQVSAIHFGKNIPLMDYSNCAMVLAELGKINLTQRLDLSKTDYRNGGHAIRYHANSYELAFYDKVKDMQQAKTSEKRAIESDYAIQQDLFATIKATPQLEVLRMELRIGNRTKLKALMKTLNVDCPMDFESLFSPTLAQKMLLHFWREISRDVPMLALSQFKPEDIYHALQMETKGAAKPAKLLQQVGALMIIQSVGMRGLHALVSGHSNERTWQRLRKELAQADIACRLKYAAMTNVQRCLEDFEPLKINHATDKKMAGGGYDTLSRHRGRTPSTTRSKYVKAVNLSRGQK